MTVVRDDGSQRHETFPVPPDDVAGAVELLIDRLAVEVAGARALWPAADYAGRLYRCAKCQGIHACCAPAEELIEGYPCPNCGEPETAITDVRVPYLPDGHHPDCDAPRNRSERRAARRARR